MADIRPFPAIRPCREKAAAVAALPYDVYSREEAAEYVAAHPESFLRIDRAETQFPGEVPYDDERVYRKAHDLLWGMVGDGTLRKEDKACYYLYELTMRGRTQTGIVGCASVDDYRNNVIKKHEDTRAAMEEDRVRHVDACNAQTGPIFLAYRADPAIDAIVERAKAREPEYDFVSEDGVRHRVFVISEEPSIAAIREAFAGIGSIYIADGHHRAASAVKVGQRRRARHPGYDGTEEFNSFLSVLFPDNQLKIWDYNRLVRDLNGLSPEEFLGEVKRRFDVAELSALTKPNPEDVGNVSAGNTGGCRAEDVPMSGAMAAPGCSVENVPEPGAAATADGPAGNGKAALGGAADAPGIREERTSAEMAAPARPQERGSFSMYLGGRWYSCRIREEDRNPDNPTEDMDVSILQRKLLAPVLGIADPRTDARIDFVGGIRGMGELVRRCGEDCAVAFAMYPTSIGELFSVADAGLLMPPKSTWFEPKLRSGLFIHAI